MREKERLVEQLMEQIEREESDHKNEEKLQLCQVCLLIWTFTGRTMFLLWYMKTVFVFLKEVYNAQQSCIYLIKNTEFFLILLKFKITIFSLNIFFN